MVRCSLAGCFAGLLLVQSASGLGLGLRSGKLRHYCFIDSDPSPRVCTPFPRPLRRQETRIPDLGDIDSQGLQDVFDALAVLQDSYYDAVNGTWPTSIDWTGAVVETVLSGTLSTLTRFLGSEDVGDEAQRKQRENLVSSIYAHVVHSYFGQNAMAIKNQVGLGPVPSPVPNAYVDISRTRRRMMTFSGSFSVGLRPSSSSGFTRNSTTPERGMAATPYQGGSAKRSRACRGTATAGSAALWSALVSFGSSPVTDGTRCCAAAA